MLNKIRLSIPGLVISAIAITGVMVSRAQTSTPTPGAGASPAPAASPVPTPAPSPKVVSVEGHLELDDIIRVQIDHLVEWDVKNDPTKLVPFLNGRAIRGNYPEEIHVSRNNVYFHLQISPESKDAWTDLLGAPGGTRRQVAFSVGLENDSPFDSVFDQSNRLPLTIISPVYGVVAAIVVFLTLIFLVWLGKTTSLIRQRGTSDVPGKLRPYNLGRTQMAFWFFVISASYVTIWLVTDALDTITPSLLGLMGISAGTALGEAMIDSSKDNANEEQSRNLTAEKQSLEQSIPELQTQVAALNTKTTLAPEDTSNRDSLNKQLDNSRTRLSVINQQIKALTPPASAGVSRGLLPDILSDGAGYSFHRFQIFVWTIVLGIIFVSSVYNNLTMPEFSATLLGLMGISSGTYIGFKFPENK
ncbi:MAG TPA: hypothetical protein VHQ95_07985 [Pyrinomonadaceae bacterium]|nr:hypothetical protein [Pyrinomonadaceae bacterium]